MSVKVVRDPHSKDSRGFAFVTMEHPEEADAALANGSGVEIMGKPMQVDRAKRGRARTRKYLNYLFYSLGFKEVVR